MYKYPKENHQQHHKPNPLWVKRSLSLGLITGLLTPAVAQPVLAADLASQKKSDMDDFVTKEQTTTTDEWTSTLPIVDQQKKEGIDLENDTLESSDQPEQTVEDNHENEVTSPPPSVVETPPAQPNVPNIPVAPPVSETPIIPPNLVGTPIIPPTIVDTVPAEPIYYTRNQTTEEFIEKIGKDAQKVAWDNDLYASVMIAQAILESASGNSKLASAPNYNLFGIKGSYEGAHVQFATLEDDGSGNMYGIQAYFRKYPSYKESLEDYAKLLKGGTAGSNAFYKGAWKSQTTSYEDATRFLTGRYATDTQYYLKLNGLIEAYQLTRFDQAPTDSDTVLVKRPKLYTIEAKDTLWDIAKVNEVSIPDLIAWNHLDTQVLHEGQTLIVGFEEQPVPIQEVIAEKEAKLSEHNKSRRDVLLNQMTQTETSQEGTEEEQAAEAVAEGEQPQEAPEVNEVQADTAAQEENAYETLAALTEQEKQLEQTQQQALDQVQSVGKNVSKNMRRVQMNQKYKKDKVYSAKAMQKGNVPYYKVQEGDTLESISKKTKVPVSKLKAWNKLDDTILATNQWLRLKP